MVAGLGTPHKADMTGSAPAPTFIAPVMRLLTSTVPFRSIVVVDTRTSGLPPKALMVLPAGSVKPAPGTTQ
jgi:hypothetical protein